MTDKQLSRMTAKDFSQICERFGMNATITTKAPVLDQTIKADAGKPQLSLVPPQIMNEIEGLKMHIDCAIDRLNELHKEVLGYTDYSLLMDAVQAGAIFYDELTALRAQLERGRCENCLYRTALDSHAGLNGCYWHCAIGRGEETKNVWHKYSRHYKDYSLVGFEDFCSSFEPEPPREG